VIAHPFQHYFRQTLREHSMVEVFLNLFGWRGCGHSKFSTSQCSISVRLLNLVTRSIINSFLLGPFLVLWTITHQCCCTLHW
jgi:hypothetical protein